MNNFQMKAHNHSCDGPTLALLALTFAQPALGAEWSITEAHLAYGNLDIPTFAGGTVESWILAQPQFRWSPIDHLSLGLEYQYWLNKLGDGATDENTLQALMVWKS